MKKLLSLVLVLSLVLGSVAFAFATPADVVGTDYEEAVTRLEALDILTGYADGTFKPENNITRAEYAAVVVRALGLDAAAIKGATNFTDVPATHWASGYVNIASGLEIVNGYGNAMFGPEDAVTYEQAVTMAVRALGYEPKAADMGGYPNGYLAVAAQEDITDGVAGVVGMAASRGVVAQLIDNSLEVPMMERTGYGDDEVYTVGDMTLLADKLDATELEDVRVDAVPLSDSDLDSDEVALDGDVYVLLAAEDANSFFGLEVTAWVNDDDEIFYWTVETDEDDIYYDTVVAINDDDVELLVEDDVFDFASGADIYVNFEAEDGDDVADEVFGRFVMDDDEVIFASLFDFDVEDATVVDVDSDEVDYISATDEDTVEFDNYDDAYYFTAEMMEAELGDVEAYNAIAYWENDDDEIFVMVADTMVKGELEAVKTKDVKVDGSWYDLSAEAFYSTDELDEVTAYDNAITALDDFMDEEVMMVLDFNGDALAMVADVDALGDTIYGIVTWAEKSKDAEMTVFNSLGEEKTYKFEERADWVDMLDDETANYFEQTSDTALVIAVEFKLNSDGEIADGKLIAATTETAVFSKANTDSNKVTINSSTRYIDSKTIFMDAVDSSNYIDPELVDYEDIYENTANDMNVRVLDATGNLNFVVFVDNFEGADDDNYYAIALEDFYEVSDDMYAELDVYQEAKDDYLLDDEVDEGDIFMFTYNNDDEVNVELTVTTTVAIDTADYDDGYVTYNGNEVKVADDVVIYTADDVAESDTGFSIDAKVSASKLDDYENVTYTRNTDGEMVVALLWNGEVSENNVATGLITAVTTTSGLESIVVDSTTPYFLNAKTILTDADDNVDAMGAALVIALLDEGDQVEVSVDGDIMTIKVLVPNAL